MKKAFFVYVEKIWKEKVDDSFVEYNRIVIDDWKYVLCCESQWIWKLAVQQEQGGEYISEKVSAVGFCLGSGLFGSYNSD